MDKTGNTFGLVKVMIVLERKGDHRFKKIVFLFEILKLENYYAFVPPSLDMRVNLSKNYLEVFVL